MAMSEEQEQDLNENMRVNSWGDRNAEGEEILQFAQAYDLGVVNTFFQNKMEHIITYKNGGRWSVIDYILIRRNNISKL